MVFLELRRDSRVRMRSDIEYNMLDKKYAPLQTGYKFYQTEVGGKYINREWVRINYNSNYSITLE